MKVRIYGAELDRWLSTDENGRVRLTQVEYTYKEYDTESMKIVGTGSEDISRERLNSEIDYKYLYIWDGERLNKGGHRWFDCMGLIRYRKSEKKAVKEYYKKKFDATEVQFR